jgi:sugar phosphate isomerase/epimerase
VDLHGDAAALAKGWLESLTIGGAKDSQAHSGQTMAFALPVQVEDRRLTGGDRAQFLLPGDGTVDYRTYFAHLKTRRYRGWNLVEVSRQLQTAPGRGAGTGAARP